MFDFEDKRSQRGVEIIHPSDRQEEKLFKRADFIEPPREDGYTNIDVDASQTRSTLDMSPVITTVKELINSYRELARVPEVDEAITQIVDSIVSADDDANAVELDLSNCTELSKELKEKIIDSMNYLFKKLGWSDDPHTIVRQKYIDGRLYVYKVVDINQVKEGIQSLVILDPRCISPVSFVKKELDPTTHHEKVVSREKGFIYDVSIHKENEQQMSMASFSSSAFQKAFKLTDASTVFIHSGLSTAKSNIILSKLDKARKPVNQYMGLLDSHVIYALSRAPERLAFHIDTGGLQSNKAEKYVKDIMNKYKTDIKYNVATGKVEDDAFKMTMTQNYWLPTSNGKGTKIEQLPGADNLGETNHLQFFKERLYKSLGIPLNRVMTNAGISFGGDITELTQEELTFSKFIRRERKSFEILFKNLLKTQLILSGLLDEDDWLEIESDISFIWNESSIIVEQRKLNTLQERISILNDAQELEGKYLSRQYLFKAIFNFTDNEIKEMNDQIKRERKEYGVDDEDDTSDDDSPSQSNKEEQ